MAPLAGALTTSEQRDRDRAALGASS
jgi:hypothetical protein